MTEIQQYEALAAPAVMEQAPDGAARPRTRDLVAWADEARAANAIAQSLAQTSFVPQQFRGKPGEVTAAILTGNEMGLSPMASLRAFDLIQGTPAMRANAMRGVVQSRGHEIWEEKVTPTEAIVCGQRHGSDKIHRSKWTIERARGLNLLGKDNWKKQPQAMLLARATAEACRMTASDVLYGVPYSTEELTDLSPEKATSTRKVKRRVLEPVPTPEPEFPEPSAGEPAADEPPAADASQDEGASGDADAWGEEQGWPAVTRPGTAATS
ncbi:hypothetical protein AB0D49_08490 [Streptomyces sp. NPDC048290]|uniref:hypothetical protein n=1 Tax=Streptomyces sp. NPDC048290 TaxID=3155811 RepID=UPI00343DBE8E